jgi:hypothetical protein
VSPSDVVCSFLSNQHRCVSVFFIVRFITSCQTTCMFVAHFLALFLLSISTVALVTTRLSFSLSIAGAVKCVSAEYHFKQQLLIQVARHVNCNKKQLLKKLEGKVRGLVVHRTQQTGRRIIAGRPRARSARIYFNRNEDTGPQTPCSRRASLQKSSQSCFLLRSKVLSFSEEKEK